MDVNQSKAVTVSKADTVTDLDRRCFFSCVDTTGAEGFTSNVGAFLRFDPLTAAAMIYAVNTCEYIIAIRDQNNKTTTTVDSGGSVRQWYIIIPVLFPGYTQASLPPRVVACRWQPNTVCTTPQ